MVLSIIIVNYNVKYFLEQCLCSVNKAIARINAEIFVVDNNSTDDSIAYLQPKFPLVNFIANNENVGFGKANNQVLKDCKGDYILFLNPDTIVPEDCFEKCISFLDNQPDGGALGIKMVDGSGTFLPESKRGFPSPIASFFKLVGLSELFPTSRIFNQYSLGYLDSFSNHKVDVLAGAFIMARQEVVLKTKGFDEAFFMYGEDIDLSYRIQQLGYNNYYFADSAIIHFKGESTKKGSLNYVKMFYSAMSIFVHKHYSGNKARAFSIFIHVAIFLRAFISLIKSSILKVGLPLIDASIIFFSLLGINKFWVSVIRGGLNFTINSLPINFFSFSILFLFTGALSGMYDKPDKPAKTFAASIAGIVVMLAVYGLLPKEWWFSRAVMIVGGFVAAVSITIFRWLLVQLNWIEPSSEAHKFKQTVVVGNMKDYHKVNQIFAKANLEDRILGRIKVNDEEENAIGDLKDLKEILLKLDIKELVFCEGYLTNYLIIQLIQSLPKNISYRFIGNGTQSIVGSDSKATAGEIMAAEDFNRISYPYYKRMKRILDLVVCAFLLITFPIQLILIKHPVNMIANCFRVLFNKKTWVGYCINNNNLPTIKPNVLTCFGLPKNTIHPLKMQALKLIDTQYAKDYDYWIDIKLIINNYKHLGG